MTAHGNELRLLVVGASGFVGRHLLAEAHRRSFSALGTQAKSQLPDLLRYDLRDTRIAEVLPSSLLTGDGPAWACVCAGFANVDACGRDPQTSRLVNVTNARRLIDDLAELGFRIVYFSTSAVFDGRSPLYDETMPPAPLHAYGRQKAEMEQFVASHHPSSLIVRLSKAVGADPAERHLFNEWEARVRQGQPIECIAGEAFSPTGVEDIAAAILRLIELGASGLYHVAGRESFERSELARLFLRTGGREALVVDRPPEHFGFVEPRQASSCLDNGKLVALTGSTFTPMPRLLDQFFQALDDGTG